MLLFFPEDAACGNFWTLACLPCFLSLSVSSLLSPSVCYAREGFSDSALQWKGGSISRQLTRSWRHPCPWRRRLRITSLHAREASLRFVCFAICFEHRWLPGSLSTEFSLCGVLRDTGGHALCLCPWMLSPSLPRRRRRRRRGDGESRPCQTSLHCAHSCRTYEPLALLSLDLFGGSAERAGPSDFLQVHSTCKLRHELAKNTGLR